MIETKTFENHFRTHSEVIFFAIPNFPGTVFYPVSYQQFVLWETG